MTLHSKLLELRQKEKQISAEIIETLQEMETGRGYLALGYSSLFDYLVRGLGYSESTAYQRQSCVRLSRELPEIKDKIERGTLTYSTVSLAFKTLKTKSIKEKREVLESIESKSTRDVKKILAEPARPLVIKKSVYREKVVLRLELTHEQNDRIEKLKKLKSNVRNIETLIAGLIDKELKVFENTDFKEPKSKNRRYIPRRLRNHVLKKASYQCQFPGCHGSDFLQIDHITPVRMGGKSEMRNLQVLCGNHNRHKG